MAEIRGHIAADTFASFYRERRESLALSDLDNPPVPPPRNKPLAPPSRGRFTVVDSPEGFSSIRHVDSGEVMHSVNRPDDEANQLYIEQSFLERRLVASPAAAEELVIWDVGLGAATNAMAVLRCFERALADSRRGEPGAGPHLRPLRLVSFECALDPLRLASGKAGYFPHVRHGAPKAILADGHWTHASGGMRWSLASSRAQYSIRKASDLGNAT
jgi:queuine tRNA-ribosyltransferase